MLLCLDRPHRIAYILGEIFELDGPEAAEVLDVRPAAFRKRLERARTQIVEFTRAHCGMVRPENRCRCGGNRTLLLQGDGQPYQNGVSD